MGKKWNGIDLTLRVISVSLETASPAGAEPIILINVNIVSQSKWYTLAYINLTALQTYFVWERVKKIQSVYQKI